MNFADEENSQFFDESLLPKKRKNSVGNDDDANSKKRKDDKNDDGGEEDDNVVDVLRFMDNENVKKIASKLYNVEIIRENQTVPGVNYVPTPHHLKDFMAANSKKKFNAGKFLTFFLNFLHERTSKYVDSPYAPLPKVDMLRILDYADIMVPNQTKNAPMPKTTALPFVFSKFDYAMVVNCKLNMNVGQHKSTTLEVINPDIVRERADLIIAKSVEKLESMRDGWRKILNVNEADEGYDKYTQAVKSMKHELRGPLERLYDHPLFEAFMTTEKFSKEGCLYLTPTVGYTTPGNTFACLELVDVEDEGTFLSNVDLSTLGSDTRVYACVRNFRLCYTSMNTFYLKGYARWAIKHD